MPRGLKNNKLLSVNTEFSEQTRLLDESLNCIFRKQNQKKISMHYMRQYFLPGTEPSILWRAIVIPLQGWQRQVPPRYHFSLSKFTDSSPKLHVPIAGPRSAYFYTVLFYVTCLVTLNINKCHQIDTRRLWRKKKERKKRRRNPEMCSLLHTDSSTMGHFSW